MRRVASIAVTVCLTLLGTLQTPFAENQPPELEQLVLTYPGARVHIETGRIRAVYGRPMAAAATPEQSARSWWEQHADSFGVSGPDLRLDGSHQLGKTPAFTVFGYRQFLDGLPVDGGTVRLLVRNELESFVVYVGAKLASAPAGGFQVDTIDGAAALEIVRTMDPYSTFPEWGEPELVIFNGADNDGPGPAVRAWRFTGSEGGLTSEVKFTFFVDAATAELVHVRDEVFHIPATDVFGHVGGNGSPGTRPDIPENPPVELDMPEIEVRIVDGGRSFTDQAGDFGIAHGGSEPITVRTSVIEGLWVSVQNDVGAELEAQTQVTPPGPANFLLNMLPTEYTTSQINGFVHTTKIHNFFKDRQPDFDGLDVQMPVVVNGSNDCDAMYNGDAILFRRAATEGPFACPNTCYSTVVAHEYGHFVHNVFGVNGGSFTEGYADAIAMLSLDTSIMGADFLGPGMSVRDYTGECNNYQYPCTEALPACGTEGTDNNVGHACGKLLAGVWWSIKLNAQAMMGPDAGLEYASQLFTDWTGITSGGHGFNSATPQTAIEVLTVDDDNGDLGDATPHAALICGAFAAHGINCPAFDAGEVPDGSALPGPQLVIDRVPGPGLGVKLDLSWGASCLAGDADYAVYEGPVGDFESHEPILCSTTGVTSALITAGSGDRYYLVVPLSASREGSYGTDDDGHQRPVGLSTCFDQSVAACR